MTARARQSRGPTAVLVTVSVAIVVLVATLAVTTASSAPPAIAAYAPQSIQQIKKAPANQNGAFGNPGGDAVGTATPPPTAAPSTTPPPPSTQPKDPRTPRLYDCVGNPPRQTEDPQSPPCVGSWLGNNGGATTKGVTGSEIRVYMPGVPDAEHTYPRVVADLQAYFNRRFNFYGRQLNLNPQPAGGSAEPSATGTCSDIQAQATWVAKELNVFAAADNGSDSCWYDGLARNKVISIAGQTTENATELKKYAPYIWGYPMEGEALMQSTGDFLCTQLNGGKATYSTDAKLSALPRVYGLLVSATLSQQPTSSARLEQRLASCGIKLAVKKVLQATSSDDQAQNQQDTASWAAEAQSDVIAMQQAGVSTLVCFCQLQAAAAVSSAMSGQGYFPEIVAERSDQNLLAQAWTSSQRRSMFEVSGFPMQVREQQSMFLAALNEVDPGFCPCSNSVTFLYSEFSYFEMMTLASGIQMAGPDLTPATFAAGLHRTTFPNPFSPLMEGKVGFTDGGYSEIYDTAVAWWSDAATSPVQADPPGSWCYVQRGRRFEPGHWPTTKLLPAQLSSAPCFT